MAEVTELIISASLVPLSEVLSCIIDEIVATVNAAKDVLFEKQNFGKVSSFLERIVPVLKELIRRNTENYEGLNVAIEILEREVRVARQLTLDCCKKNKMYLLLNCKRIVRKLQDTTREISRALSLIPLASLGISSSIKEEVDELCAIMLDAEFKAALAEEKVLEQIESGIQERNADRTYANNLLIHIAEAVGVSTERSELKKVLDELKTEIEEARLRKDQAEAIQMEQIIALLGRADAALSPRERQKIYFEKKNSLGSQPLEALQSFYCPITRDIMVDPVETNSGQTFERMAIEKWIADGNTTCPMTMSPLNSGMLRPNVTLRKSIEEWKDRNTLIMIAQMKTKLCSGNEQEEIQCLSYLGQLCEEKELHREWVALENYIPILVGFLGRHNPEIRQHALAILCILAKDHDANKVCLSTYQININHPFY